MERISCQNSNMQSFDSNIQTFNPSIQICHHSIQTFNSSIQTFSPASVATYKHAILCLFDRSSSLPSFVSFIIRCSLGPSSVKGWKWCVTLFRNEMTTAGCHIKECMGILYCRQNVLKCNKIVHPAQLTCVGVISCASGAIGGVARKIDLTPNWRFMATRIKEKYQVRFRYVANLSEKWNLEEKSRLLKFLEINGCWNRSRCFRAAPHYLIVFQYLKFPIHSFIWRLP